MPDLERIGGVTGWLRSAAIAGAAGLSMSTHLYPEFSAHLMRVTETADWLEWRDWGVPFLAEPFEIRDSAIHILDRAGAGIRWDEAAVKRFASRLSARNGRIVLANSDPRLGRFEP
jgi:mandelate racemase